MPLTRRASRCAAPGKLSTTKAPLLNCLEGDQEVLRFLSRWKVQPNRSGDILLGGAPALHHGHLGGWPPGRLDAKDSFVSLGPLQMPGGGPRPLWAACPRGLAQAPGSGVPGSVTGLATPAETLSRPVAPQPKVRHGRGDKIPQELPCLGTASGQGERPWETWATAGSFGCKNLGPWGVSAKKPCHPLPEATNVSAAHP